MRAPILLFTVVGVALSQVPNPTQQPASDTATRQPVPIFRVTVVSRTTKAINYHHRTGSTRIDFRGTELMPSARGEARVESQMGSTKIETRLEKMTPAAQYGPEYMTYVLWAITPEGRAMNLGEVALEGDHAKLLSTTDLQTFGLIVTAEPYFAVTQPSDVVVAENFVRNDTSGTIEQVDAKYELWQRGQYVLNRAAYRPVKVDPKGRKRGRDRARGRGREIRCRHLPKGSGQPAQRPGLPQRQEQGPEAERDQRARGRANGRRCPHHHLPPHSRRPTRRRASRRRRARGRRPGPGAPGG